jgi:hypothetical protein
MPYLMHLIGNVFSVSVEIFVICFILKIEIKLKTVMGDNFIQYNSANKVHSKQKQKKKKGQQQKELQNGENLSPNLEQTQTCVCIKFIDGMLHLYSPVFSVFLLE